MTEETRLSLEDYRRLHETYQIIVRAWGKTLVESGEIDPVGLTEEQLAKKILEYVDANLGTEIEFAIKIDHTPVLLEQAREFRRNERLDFSIMFYATWIEHFVNQMLVARMNRLKFHETSHTELLRLSFHLKLGLAWKLLFGEDTLDEQLVKNILKIADSRNSFVHYKWRAFDPDGGDMSRLDSEKVAIITLAESVILSLKAFHSQKVFGGLAEYWSTWKTDPLIKIDDDGSETHQPFEGDPD